jgi:hypothetical protein
LPMTSFALPFTSSTTPSIPCLAPLSSLIAISLFS